MKREGLKKIICIAFILIMCMVILCSCDRNKIGKTYYIADDITFVYVARCEQFSLYVHKETKVIYICKEPIDAKHYGGISPLIDENGKPILWENEE